MSPKLLIVGGAASIAGLSAAYAAAPVNGNRALISDNLSLILISLIAGIPAIIAALKAGKTKDAVEQAKAVTVEKLEVIGRDVNHNLSKALADKENAIAQNKIAMKLLVTLNPDNEVVKALVASMEVPGAPQAQPNAGATSPIST